MSDAPSVTAAVDLYRVRMPLRHPHRAAHGREDDRSSIIVRRELSDGSIGWGECPALTAPTYTAEYHDGAWAVLRDHLAPAALHPPSTPHHLPPFVGHPMAQGALGDAWADARLRAEGRSLADRLGLASRPLPTTTIVSLTDSLDELLGAVAAAPGAVKLKIAPGLDVEPLRAVRAAHPELVLAADANASYGEGFASNRAVFAAIDELGLRYLEQPHPGIAANAALAREIATPICLDEPIDSVEAAELALAAGALSVLNVKPARVGGVRPAVRLVRWCRNRGVDAFIGGMLETGVGRASAAVLAGLPGCTLPTDLGPSDQYWEQDITEPVLADGQGRLIPPGAPGQGGEPDPARLAAVTVEHLTFRR